jgi:hypothetical protein
MGDEVTAAVLNADGTQNRLVDSGSPKPRATST